ncbi:MAG: zinc ribbon domain-containing protein [Acidobacteriota bacterium]|nr:zinc ribbon domain-containing protein [Blastocatellia bacterium]MDW8239085.1 zinc ribbon domain-containing protein [Acidobacteriota bacterium]
MYCPNCGRQAAPTQRFCKSCGYNLAALMQSMSVSSSSSPASIDDIREERRRLEQARHGLRTAFTGLGLALFFLLFFKSWAFAAIGLIVLFKGLGQIASATLWATPKRTLEFRWPRESHVTPLPTPPQIATPTSYVEPSPPVSVTEHTTLRLDQPNISLPPERNRAVE